VKERQSHLLQAPALRKEGRNTAFDADHYEIVEGVHWMWEGELSPLLQAHSPQTGASSA
jgi:hypothetical protein